MSSHRITVRGLLLARSPVILRDPPSILLELQTHEGQRIKIVATNELFDHIECGKHYTFISLRPRRVEEFDHVVYQLHYQSQIQLEEMPFCRELDEQTVHNFVGTITSVDEDFCIYEVDDSKTLALSYHRQYCQWPALQVGDKVMVKRPHLYTDRQGNHYYVLCLRSYFSIKPITLENRRPGESSAFILFVEAYGLGMECLLLLREHQHVIKDCIKDTFLQSLGVPLVEVVYRDVLFMLLSTQEYFAEKIRIWPFKRNTLLEFFSEPHSCLPMQNDGLTLPHMPLSLFEGLEPLLGMDVQNDEGTGWAYNISNTEDNRPFLAYIGISEKSTRLSLMDGSGLEIPIVPVQGKLVPEQDFRRLCNKIVLVEKPLLIVERYTEEEDPDPAAEYLKCSEYKYICVMVELDNIKVFGPRDMDFPSWTYITVADFVKQNDQEFTKCTQNREATPLFPLQENSSLDSYIAERCIVLHKNPLQMANAQEIFNPPWIYALKSKLKIKELIVIPPKVEIYIVGSSRRIHADLYSVGEAINDPSCQDELISIKGVVARRSVETGKFPREHWGISYDRNFGLPGSYSLLILDLHDQVSNPNDFVTSTRVYVSWHNSYQYPLGVLPGATVVVNCVYKTQSNSKTYFRSTSLTSIEVVQLPSPSSSGTKLFVDVPSGPWLFPHELSEGASCWFIFQPQYLTKLELKSVCKQCGEPYVNGICTYPGCSSPLGPKLSALARVLVEHAYVEDSLLVRDENVQVLLGFDELEWNSLLVLAEQTGTLRYIQKDKFCVKRYSVEDHSYAIADDLKTSDKTVLVAFFVSYCNGLLTTRRSKWPNLSLNLATQNKLFFVKTYGWGTKR